MLNPQTVKVIRYVVPSMLSNICFFLFTVVDGIFVGRGTGTNGLGAVNIVIPYVMTTAAVFQMINIGGATIFAVYIGKNDIKEARRVFRGSMTLLMASAVILSGAGVFFTRSVCRLLGASDTFLEMASDYLFWYSAFVIPSGLSMALQTYCRNDNAPGLVGAAVLISTALNIFGDWYLIFPLKMGTAGAAIATGVSQSAGLAAVLIHYVRKQGILRFGRAEADRRPWKDILIHGLPEGIAQLATPASTLCMNLVLISRIGDIGVNAFSIISYVASFTVAIFFGTSEGLQPLFGQCYGMKEQRELKFFFRVGIWINFIGSAAVIGLLILFDRRICQMFKADSATLEYTLAVLPEYASGFVVMAFNVMISAYLYSTERSKYALLISFLRSLVISVLVILILPEIFGAGIIWYTFAIYEAAVLVIAAALLRHSERNGIVFK